MDRLILKSDNKSFDNMLKMFERRIRASISGLCAVDMTRAFLSAYQAQSCGKCTPCRIGTRLLLELFDNILDSKATPETLKEIEKVANTMLLSSDCEIGSNTGSLVLYALREFKDDFESHVKSSRCIMQTRQAVPCVSKCPANVDVPGYIALANAKKYKDVVRLIRKDNPFPVACAYICDHPCESNCRRMIVDAAINIRGIKKASVDRAGFVESEKAEADTGKRVAIIGGGPSGLTAAYFLRLMGHSVSIYEANERLGGMLYYGIPRYRLPQKQLDRDIDNILSLGIDVHLNEKIGDKVTVDELRKSYDAVYISIGAQVDNKVSVEGEDAKNVISAVTMLRVAASLKSPSLKGKKVVVIGGGNVAMDCTRTALRLGAERVSVVYRRRRDDMTALQAEIEAAIAEGAEIMDLTSHKRIVKDENNNAVGLVVKRNMVSVIGSDGRPKVKESNTEEITIPADLIIFAIGQGIDSAHFEQSGLAVEKNIFKTDKTGRILGSEGVFAGGDCVTGPGSAINAIAAGKVAAANIDAFLGYNHEISVDVKIPETEFTDIKPCGRVNTRERSGHDSKNDFEEVEVPFTDEEVAQETSRCLRCDCFGFGIFKNGREQKW